MELLEKMLVVKLLCTQHNSCLTVRKYVYIYERQVFTTLYMGMEDDEIKTEEGLKPGLGICHKGCANIDKRLTQTLYLYRTIVQCLDNKPLLLFP